MLCRKFKPRLHYRFVCCREGLFVLNRHFRVISLHQIASRNYTALRLIYERASKKKTHKTLLPKMKANCKLVRKNITIKWICSKSDQEDKSFRTPN